MSNQKSAWKWKSSNGVFFLLCPQLPSLPFCGPVAMESSSVASASSEAGSTRSQEIEELERFIDSYVLEYQVQGLLNDKNDPDPDVDKTPSHISQVTKARWRHISTSSMITLLRVLHVLFLVLHMFLVLATVRSVKTLFTFVRLNKNIWTVGRLKELGFKTFELCGKLKAKIF